MRILISTLLIVLWTGIAFALPSQTDSKLSWEAYADQKVIDSGGGFFVYWCDPSVNDCTQDASYTDANKVDIGFPTVDTTTNTQGVVVLSFMPNALHELCFRLTAYLVKSDGTKVESSFSNTACGFFGIPTASGVNVQ